MTINRDDRFTAALQEAAAYAPADDVFLDTLEIRQAAFINEEGVNVPIRAVRNTENITAKLEATAPVDPNTFVEFIAFAFDFNFPGIEPGVAPQIEISLSDVPSPFADGRRLSHHLEDAALDGNPIYIIHRLYMYSDLTAPAATPIPMQLGVAQVQGGKISAPAYFVPDDESRSFPRERYTGEKFKLLAAQPR